MSLACFSDLARAAQFTRPRCTKAVLSPSKERSRAEWTACRLRASRLASRVKLCQFRKTDLARPLQSPHSHLVRDTSTACLLRSRRRSASDMCWCRRSWCLCSWSISIFCSFSCSASKASWCLFVRLLCKLSIFQRRKQQWSSPRTLPSAQRRSSISTDAERLARAVLFLLRRPHTCMTRVTSPFRAPLSHVAMTTSMSLWPFLARASIASSLSCSILSWSFCCSSKRLSKEERSTSCSASCLRTSLCDHCMWRHAAKMECIVPFLFPSTQVKTAAWMRAAICFRPFSLCA
mmetsp:Transcript_111878/g.311394  ORF Transcript_111878/g.311394 Transcript_111878/m.311394 type:complete len:291 (-) Transcript_111878:1087-1959(-)